MTDPRHGSRHVAHYPNFKTIPPALTPGASDLIKRTHVMSRFRFAAALCALLAISAIAAAADTPLSRISDDADIVIRLKAPKSTIDKVASLAEKVQPGVGAMVRQHGTDLGNAISNPTLAGVDQSKDWYISVFTKGQEEPSILFAVPVTDAEAAKGAVGDEFSTKSADKWLFYSKDEDVLPEESIEESVTSAMRGEPAAIFDKGDLSVFVNIANLTEAYSDEIEKGQQQIAAVIDQVGDQMPPTPGMDMKAILGIYTQMIDQTVQGAKDAEQFTVAINVADDGVTAEEYVSFGESTTTAAALANHPRNEMKTVAKLTGEAMIVYGASVDMKKLMDWGMQFTSQMFGENESLKSVVEEFQAGSKDLNWGPIVGSISLGPVEEGLVRSVQIAEVSPAARYKELARSITAKMGSIDLNGMKQTTTVEPDAERFGSQKADIVTVTQEFGENADPTGMQKKMQTMLFGPEGMKSYVVYQADKIIQSMGGGKEAMTAALKNLDSSTGTAADHRKGLIPNPNVLVLFDLAGLAVQGLRVASAIPGLPIPVTAEQLDELKFDRSFVGFSAAVDKNAIRVKSRIPVAQIQALASLGSLFQNMRQQQNN
jgi:hypothetical protein